LTKEAVRSAFEKHGPNIIVTKHSPKAITLLYAAAAHLFNFILIVVAIFSIAMGDKAMFIVMMFMVFASTGLRFIFSLQ
jgi:Mg2+-importing ATPase